MVAVSLKKKNKKIFFFFFFCIFLFFFFFFFFQAEDGIRDQPRSRGLGDVYKRQVVDRILSKEGSNNAGALSVRMQLLSKIKRICDAVSYTHLTLPTKA